MRQNEKYESASSDFVKSILLLPWVQFNDNFIAVLNPVISDTLWENCLLSYLKSECICVL